jgi:hypothetical protein
LSRNRKYIGPFSEEIPGLDGKHDGPRTPSALSKKKNLRKQMIYL